MGEDSRSYELSHRFFVVLTREPHASSHLPVLDSVLLDSTAAPIEKAQAVEDMLLESKDRIDESVDEADE